MSTMHTQRASYSFYRRGKRFIAALTAIVFFSSQMAFAAGLERNLAPISEFKLSMAAFFAGYIQEIQKLAETFTDSAKVRKLILTADGIALKAHNAYEQGQIDSDGLEIVRRAFDRLAGLGDGVSVQEAPVESGADALIDESSKALLAGDGVSLPIGDGRFGDLQPARTFIQDNRERLLNPKTFKAAVDEWMQDYANGFLISDIPTYQRIATYLEMVDEDGGRTVTDERLVIVLSYLARASVLLKDAYERASEIDDLIYGSEVAKQVKSHRFTFTARALEDVRGTSLTVLNDLSELKEGELEEEQKKVNPRFNEMGHSNLFSLNVPSKEETLDKLLEALEDVGRAFVRHEKNHWASFYGDRSRFFLEHQQAENKPTVFLGELEGALKEQVREHEIPGLRKGTLIGGVIEGIKYAEFRKGYENIFFKLEALEGDYSSMAENDEGVDQEIGQPVGIGADEIVANAFIAPYDEEFFDYMDFRVSGTLAQFHDKTIPFSKRSPYKKFHLAARFLADVAIYDEIGWKSESMGRGKRGVNSEKIDELITAFRAEFGKELVDSLIKDYKKLFVTLKIKAQRVDGDLVRVFTESVKGEKIAELNKYNISILDSKIIFAERPEKVFVQRVDQETLEKFASLGDAKLSRDEQGNIVAALLNDGQIGIVRNDASSEQLIRRTGRWAGLVSALVGDGVPGRIVILSGPSGVGKGAVLAEILEWSRSLKQIRGVTTRELRKEGLDDKERVSEREFLEMVENGTFLEWIKSGDTHYGTKVADVIEMLKQSLIPVFDIDPKGAAAIRDWAKENGVEVLDFFITPVPLTEGKVDIAAAKDELESRLIERDTEKKIAIAERVKDSERYFKEADKYSHIVVNERKKLNATIDEIKNIINEARVGDHVKRVNAQNEEHKERAREILIQNVEVWVGFDDMMKLGLRDPVYGPAAADFLIMEFHNADTR